MKRKIASIMVAVAMSFAMVGCGFFGGDEPSVTQEDNGGKKHSETAPEDDETSKDGSGAETGSEEETGSGKENGSETENGTAENSGAAGNENQGSADAITYYIDLDSKDAYGNAVTTEELLANAKIVMINFWEPWCGPCVGEIPDLELLYENYKEQGLVIIGLYTSSDMLGDIQDIIETDGLTYPIVEATSDTYRYMSDYVPTTVFLDSYGSPLPDCQYIGARGYNDWASIIEYYFRTMDY